LEQASKLREIQEWLGDEPVTLHFVPDLHELATLGGYIEDFDGLPDCDLAVIAAHRLEFTIEARRRSCRRRLGSADLRAGHRVGCAGDSLLVTRTCALSAGTYGVGWREISNAQIRTMVNDAERHTGPVWAADDDPRVTSLGGGCGTGASMNYRN
jgi:hypothetical protein